jgi:alpha-glucoside transport system permease protein
MLIAFRNNLLWLVIFTAFTVSLGLIFAVIFDRVRYEPIVKSIIFLPMAISFVGAGVIWKFVYAYKPAGEPQIGVLNAILNNFGIEPIGWLVNKTTNNLALIAVGIWIWVGFCMVILSAAYKGIPKELLEAARVDGANELQVFWRITIPSMAPTIGVVTTTMIINVLKVFDIVYVMTNGQFDTEVIANRMYKEMFQFHNFGRASAIAVILLLLIVPMMIINVRRFKRQEKM